MNNPRLERVIADIEKVKDKIAEQQSRLRTLERQKTDIENGQIIALVRSERISDTELSALLKSQAALRCRPGLRCAACDFTTNQNKTGGTAQCE